MEDFIYEKPNALNRKECADIIEYFEIMRKQGLVINRQAMGDGLAHHKKDESIFLLEPDTLRLEKTAPTSVMLIEKINSASFANGILRLEVAKTNGKGEWIETGTLEIPGSLVANVISQISTLRHITADKLPCLILASQ